jgi:CTP-dependent riboflavin kinase
MNMQQLFNQYKNKELSRFEALYDLMLTAKEGMDTTTFELKTRWNWDHHSKVVRFLSELEKQEIIKKRRSKKGTFLKIII